MRVAAAIAVIGLALGAVRLVEAQGPAARRIGEAKTIQVALYASPEVVALHVDTAALRAKVERRLIDEGLRITVDAAESDGTLLVTINFVRWPNTTYVGGYLRMDFFKVLLQPRGRPLLASTWAASEPAIGFDAALLGQIQRALDRMLNDFVTTWRADNPRVSTPSPTPTPPPSGTPARADEGQGINA